jgi:hypothetical protein
MATKITSSNKGIHKVIITFSFNVIDGESIPEYKSDKENVKIIPIKFEDQRFFRTNAEGIIKIKSKIKLKNLTKIYQEIKNASCNF